MNPCLGAFHILPAILTAIPASCSSSMLTLLWKICSWLLKNQLAFLPSRFLIQLLCWYATPGTADCQRGSRHVNNLASYLLGPLLCQSPPLILRQGQPAAAPRFWGLVRRIAASLCFGTPPFRCSRKSCRMHCAHLELAGYA